MAGIFGDEINNRQEFLAQLSEATEKCRALLRRLPHEDTLESVLKQLEAISGWTAKGAKPTRAQRKSIDMSLRLYREYEVTDDSAVRAFRDLISGLNSYVAFWPDDKTASDPKNDDYLFLSDL